MYILVSNSNRVPSDLEGLQVEHWSFDEFYAKATGDDFELDEGLWFDASILTEDVYKSLIEYKQLVTIVFYRFDDTLPPAFNVEDIKVYPAEVKAPVFTDTPSAPDFMTETTIGMRPGSQPAPEAPAPVTPTVETPVQPEPAPAPVMQAPVAPAPQVPVQQEPVQQTPIQTTPTLQIPHSQFATPMDAMNEPEPAPAPAPAPAPVVEPTPLTQQAPIQQIPEDDDKRGMASYLENSGSGFAIAGEADIKSGVSIGDRAKASLSKLLQGSADDMRKPGEPGKVILFGSSKGGTGKTFTTLMNAYWFAKNHPELKTAVADFDIIDGQIAVTTHNYTPTILDFYKPFKTGSHSFGDLMACSRKIEKFGNIDFYLAPPLDLPEVTDDEDFWDTIFKYLVENYDVIFFDSGIDYKGKLPISKLYKMADKIIITCNPSINSVQSVVRQMQTLSGQRANNIFFPQDGILERCNIVMTRVSDISEDILGLIKENLEPYANIIAAFGNIDGIIHEIEWYGRWELLDEKSTITDYLEVISEL